MACVFPYITAMERIDSKLPFFFLRQPVKGLVNLKDAIDLTSFNAVALDIAKPWVAKAWSKAPAIPGSEAGDIPDRMSTHGISEIIPEDRIKERSTG